MLTISPAATAAIQMLSLPDVPERSGLRILRGPQDSDKPRSIAVIDRPRAQDEVITATADHCRAAVFIDPDAAEIVEGQFLDATIKRGQMTFSLKPEPGGDRLPLRRRVD